MSTPITITTEYITLGQLLKLTNIVSSGGEIKQYLLDNKILVNDVVENRRGRKLKNNDVVNVNSRTFLIKVNL
jgi:S4 domain protein YaaA